MTDGEMAKFTEGLRLGWLDASKGIASNLAEVASADPEVVAFSRGYSQGRTLHRSGIACPPEPIKRERRRERHTDARVAEAWRHWGNEMRLTCERIAYSIEKEESSDEVSNLRVRREQERQAIVRGADEPHR